MSLLPFSVPEPPRSLGREGRRLWDMLWGMRKPWIDPVLDLEHVALLCESMDERQILRLAALKGDDWRDRVALRNLDAQIMALMSALALNPTDRKTLSVGATNDNNSRLSSLRANLAGNGASSA